MTNAVVDLKAKALENRKKQKPLVDMINQSLQELGKALPSHLKAERIARIATTCIRTNPKIAECTPESFIGALFQSAQLGLEPDIDGQCYFIPYTNSKKIGNTWTKVKEIQFQIGYKGYISLFYRHQNNLSLDMHAVHENDLFEYGYGTDAMLKHRPKLKKDRGKVIAYYAIAKLANGGSIFKVMSKEEILNHAIKHSKMYDKEKGMLTGVWVTDPDAMAKKTVLLQLMKLLPKSAELQQAVEMDNTTKSTIRPDMLQVKDENFYESSEMPSSEATE